MCCRSWGGYWMSNVNTRKLGDICTIVSGGTPSRSKLEYWNGGTISWIKISNIKNKYVNESDEKITKLGLEESSAKMLTKGTILYTIFATLGEVAILDIDACTNQAIAGINIKNTDILINDFLYYFLMSKKDYVNNIGRGVAQNNINMSILRNIDIPLPPIDIQRKIVSNLDKVTHIMDLCNTILEKLDLLVKSQFVEMFGDPVTNEKHWEMKPLLSMGNCKNGMNFHRDDKGVEINCLGVGDFNDSSTIEDTSKLPTISLNEIPSEEYLLKNDDIVFVRSNGNKALVGRSIAVYPEKIPTTFSGFCIRYRRTDDSVNTPYLLRFFKAESIRQRMVGRGANIQNLNQQILGELIIPVPPLDLQNQFADFVKTIDKSKFDVQLLIKNIRRVKFYDQF